MAKHFTSWATGHPSNIAVMVMLENFPYNAGVVHPCPLWQYENDWVKINVKGVKRTNENIDGGYGKDCRNQQLNKVDDAMDRRK